MGFRELFPQVFIDKIVLSNVAKDDDNAEINPHIDSTREPNMVYNSTTGKVEPEIVLPDYSKKATESSPIHVSLELVIPETEKNIPNKWFDNVDLYEFYRIRVVQSIRREETEKLLNTDSLFSNYDDIKAVKIKDYSFAELRRPLLESGDNRPYLPITIQYDIMDSQVSHLAYFAVVYLDLDDIAKKYNMSFPPNSFQAFEGVMAVEIALQEGEEPSVSHDGTQVIISSKVQDFRHLNHLKEIEFDMATLQNNLLNSRATKVLNSDFLDIAHKGRYIGNFQVARDSQGRARFVFGIDLLSVAKNCSPYSLIFQDPTELLSYFKMSNLKIYRIRLSNNKESRKDTDGIAWFDSTTDAPELIAESGDTSSRVFKKGEKREREGLKTRIGTIQEVVLNITDNIGVRHFTGVDHSMKDVTFGLYKYMVEVSIEDRVGLFLAENLDKLRGAQERLEGYFVKAQNPKAFDSNTGRFHPTFSTQVEAEYSNIQSAPWIDSIAVFMGIVNRFYGGIDLNKVSKFLYLISNPRTGSNSGIAKVVEIIDTFINEMERSIGIKISGQSTTWSRGQSITQYGSSVSKNHSAIRTIDIHGFSEVPFDSDVWKNVGCDYLSIGGFDTENNDDGLKAVSSADFAKRVETEVLKYFKSVSVDINLSIDKEKITVDDKMENTKFSFLTPSIISLGEETKVFLNSSIILRDSNKLEFVHKAAALINASTRLPQQILSCIAAKGNLLKNPEATRYATSEFLSFMLSDHSTTVFTVKDKSLPTPSLASTIDVRDMVGNMSNFNQEGLSKEYNSTCPVDIPSSKEVLQITQTMSSLFTAMNIVSGRDSDKKVTNRKMKSGQKRVTSRDIISNMNISDNNSLFLNNLNAMSSDKRALVVKNLPLPMKALALSFVNSNVTTFDLNTLNNAIKGGATAELGDSSLVHINFNMISKIEVFTGYNSVRDVPSVKGKKTPVKAHREITQPQWRLLTEDYIKKSLDSQLLCRITAHEDQMTGQKAPTDIVLPVLNEYFILSPKSQLVAPPPPATQETVNAKELSDRERSVLAGNLSREEPKIKDWLDKFDKAVKNKEVKVKELTDKERSVLAGNLSREDPKGKIKDFMIPPASTVPAEDNNFDVTLKGSSADLFSAKGPGSFKGGKFKL